MRPVLVFFSAILAAAPGCGRVELEATSAEGPPLFALDAGFARKPRPSQPARKSGSAPAAAPAAEVRFSSSQTTGVQPAGENTFSLDTRSVFVSVVWSGLSGDHTQALELYAPGGALWQVMERSFSASGVEQLADGRWQTWEEIPVAGTAISTYQLTGTWIARVSLDDGKALASSAFDLW